MGRLMLDVVRIFVFFLIYIFFKYTPPFFRTLEYEFVAAILFFSVWFFLYHHTILAYRARTVMCRQAHSLSRIRTKHSTQLIHFAGKSARRKKSIIFSAYHCIFNVSRFFFVVAIFRHIWLKTVLPYVRIYTYREQRRGLRVWWDREIAGFTFII